VHPARLASIPSALALVAIGLASAAGSSSAASPPPQPGPSIAPATRPARTPPGDLPGFARPGDDVGRLPPDTPLTGMSLLFDMTPAQQIRSRLVLADLQDPTSPRYHRWLDPRRYAAWFGPTAADTASARAWLEDHGFTVHGPSSNGRRLFFSGTATQVEQAFRTELHRYDVHGEHHFAPAVQPTYPAELGAPVLGVRGLHDFRLTAASRARPARVAPGYTFDVDSGAGLDGEYLTLAPADFAAIYDVSRLYAEGITGAGQKIAVVGVSDYNDADILAFRQTFGLDTSNLPTRHLVALSGASNTNPDLSEATLDLEWSGAVARDASLHYFYTGDNYSYGPYDAILAAIEDGSYPIISSSFSGCEKGFSAADVVFLEQMGDAAAMQGTTLVNDSGDWGPAGCDFTDSRTSPSRA